MKKFFTRMLAGMIGILFVATSAFAQVYPSTNPTYIPNSRLPVFTVTSNVPATTMQLNGTGTVTLQLTGTCTNLVGAIQASNDGTNFVTLNVYPSNVTTAASAITSITATGLYTANVAGYDKVRMTNTGVTGTACVGTMVGSPQAFALPR